MMNSYKTILITLGGLVCLGLTSAPANALVLASSTFDSNNEGWFVGDLLPGGSSSSATWVANGGNPGGFIRTTDISSLSAFRAPAAFLGNKSSAYGGTLSLDERLLTSDNVNYPMIVISNGSLNLQFRTPPPTTNWTSYSIAFLASAGWEIVTDGVLPGPAATEAQLQQVLSNLTALNIEADWQTGQDQVDLDNVRLIEGQPVPESTPEPTSTLSLLALGILGAASTLKRKLKHTKSTEKETTKVS